MHFHAQSNGEYTDWDVFWAVYNYDGNPLDITGWLWLPYAQYIYYPFMIFGKDTGYVLFVAVSLLAAIGTFYGIHQISAKFAWGWFIGAGVPIFIDFYFGNINIILAFLILLSWKILKKRHWFRIILASLILAFILFKFNTILTVPLYVLVLLDPNGGLHFLKKEKIRRNWKGALLGVASFILFVLLFNFEMIVNPDIFFEFIKAELPFSTEFTGFAKIILLILEYYHLVFLYVVGGLYLIHLFPDRKSEVMRDYSIFMIIWFIAVRIAFFAVFWEEYASS